MYWLCIRDLLIYYDQGYAPSGSPRGEVPGMMYFTCIVNVSGMYHECGMMVITMYLSWIVDVLEYVPYTSVSYHALPITFLGPSLLGHPVLSISRPCVWLLVSGDSYGMAAPDMLFGRQGMHVPACPVWCCPAETTACQASTWGPNTAPGLTHWAGVGGQTLQWKIPVKSQWRSQKN